MGERSIEFVKRLSDFTMAHERGIKGLAWLPSGTVVVATGEELAIWNVDEQRRLRSFPTHEVVGLAVSRDGALGVTGCEEGCVHAWDLARETLLADLGTHDLGPDNQRRYVSAVGISADGGVAVSSAYDRTLKIWDVHARVLRHTVTLPDMAYGCAISPDGKHAAAGGSDKILRIVDATTGEIIHTSAPMEDFMSSVSFSPDGKLIATTTDGPQAELWDAETGELLVKWKVPGQTRECGFYPDGSRVWTTGGSYASTYSVPTAEPLGDLRSPQANCVSIAPDGARLVHGGGDGRLRIGEPVATTKGPKLQIINDEDEEKGEYSEPLMSVAWSADGKRLVTVDEGGRIALFDADAGTRLWRLPKAKGKPVSEGGMFATAFSPSGKLALTGGNDDKVRLWDLTEAKQVKRLDGHDTMINDCVFLDEERALTSGDDRLVIWNLSTGKPIAKSDDDTGGNGIALSRDGERVFVGGESCVVRVHDLKSLKLASSFEDGHTGAIRALAVTPDGRRVVSASADQTVRVWDITSGKCLHTLVGHQGPVRGVDVFGNRAISASSDNTLRIWDLDTGAHVATLEGHSVYVTWVKVSPDGKLAASASGDGSVRLWDLTQINTIDPSAPPPDSTPITAVTFSADGSKVYAGTEKGLVRVWSTETYAALPPLRGGRFEVRSLAVRGDYVVTGVEQGAYLWAGDAAPKHLCDDYGTRLVAMDEEATQVVALESGSVHAWSLPGGEELSRADMGKSADCAAVLSDGASAVICCDDKLKVISIKSGRGKFPQLKLPGDAKDIALVSDKRAVVAYEGGLCLVDLAGKKVGKKVKILDGDGDAREIEAIALTTDKQHVALLLHGPLELAVYEVKKLSLVAKTELGFADYPLKAVACGTGGGIAVGTARGDVVLYKL